MEMVRKRWICIFLYKQNITKQCAALISTASASASDTDTDAEIQIQIQRYSYNSITNNKRAGPSKRRPTFITTELNCHCLYTFSRKGREELGNLEKCCVKSNGKLFFNAASICLIINFCQDSLSLSPLASPSLSPVFRLKEAPPPPSSSTCCHRHPGK